jgi:hypothetical protein
VSTLIIDDISQLETRLPGGSELITFGGTRYLEKLLGSLVTEGELEKLKLQGAQEETYEQFAARVLYGIAREVDSERLYVLLLTEAVQIRAHVMVEFPHNAPLLRWAVRRSLGLALPKEAIQVLQPYLPAYRLERLRVYQHLSDEALFGAYQALVDLIGKPSVSSRTIRKKLLRVLALPAHGTWKAAYLRNLP